VSKRGHEYARRRRQKLLESLGGRCAACGATEDLQLDLISRAGIKSHGNGVLGRLCFYVRQWRLGNVRCLCADCNQMKADMADELFWQKLITEKERVYSYPINKPGEQLQHLRNPLTPREIRS
jgi:hypothetical protein